MLEAVLVALGIAAVVVFLILFSGLKKVNQYERGMVERWNAYEKTVEPGLRYIRPFVQRIYRVNMR